MRPYLTTLLLALAIPGAAQAQTYYARERLSPLASPAAPVVPPAPTPKTTCGAFQQNHLASNSPTYLRAAVGATLAARQADAKAACEAAQATVCAYNDSAPAAGGGYTIYIDRTAPGSIRYAQSTVYYASICS